MTFYSPLEQRAAYAVIDVVNDGASPSYRAIAAKSGLNLSHTHKLIRALQARGLVRLGEKPVCHYSAFQVFTWNNETKALERWG